MVYIIAIHMEGGNQYEHVTEVRWKQDQESNTATTHQMIDWINKGNKAYVSDGMFSVPVLVVDANPPYLRTYADNRWTNNLLALPKY